MGVCLRSWDQTAKWGMAHVKFSSSKESMHEQIQGENHDYCFFLTAVALCAKNLYLQDRQLITPSRKMSWNDFENGFSKSEGTLDMIGCCNTITHQLTLRFQFKNFWRRKTFPYFHILTYSPDRTPCDFCLFPKLKSKLKGHHFGTMENIQKIVTNELNTLKENDFQYSYDQW